MHASEDDMRYLAECSDEIKRPPVQLIADEGAWRGVKYALIAEAFVALVVLIAWEVVRWMSR